MTSTISLQKSMGWLSGTDSLYSRRPSLPTSVVLPSGNLSVRRPSTGNSVRLCLDKNRTIPYSRNEVISKLILRPVAVDGEENVPYHIISFKDFPATSDELTRDEADLLVEDLRVDLKNEVVCGILELRTAKNDKKLAKKDGPPEHVGIIVSLAGSTTEIQILASKLSQPSLQGPEWQLYEFAFPCGRQSKFLNEIERLIANNTNSENAKWKVEITFRAEEGDAKLEWQVQAIVTKILAAKDATQSTVLELAERPAPIRHWASLSGSPTSRPRLSTSASGSPKPSGHFGSIAPFLTLSSSPVSSPRIAPKQTARRSSRSRRCESSSNESLDEPVSSAGLYYGSFYSPSYHASGVLVSGLAAGKLRG